VCVCVCVRDVLCVRNVSRGVIEFDVRAR